MRPSQAPHTVPRKTATPPRRAWTTKAPQKTAARTPGRVSRDRQTHRGRSIRVVHIPAHHVKGRASAALRSIFSAFAKEATPVYRTRGIRQHLAHVRSVRNDGRFHPARSTASRADRATRSGEQDIAVRCRRAGYGEHHLLGRAGNGSRTWTCAVSRCRKKRSRTDFFHALPDHRLFHPAPISGDMYHA